ncbi:MAG TPA: cytochrome c biogenesis protein CcsA [Vicinamibacterales bacterium]|nr:cytochrome c biogenesis protein CcsA [Vicinamibacterales bacterium]
MTTNWADRMFMPLAVLAAAMFAVAPFLILGAPYESTMGLVQKIFYFHVPSAMTMFLSAFVCGIASAVFLFARRPAADRVAVAAAELTTVFGVIVLLTGPMWARKAWGVWWQWDARLTSTLVLWLIFMAYLLLRRYGGPGSERLAAGVALFGMANVPFVYWSVNVWRTVHPKTSVVPTLQAGMRGPFWFCVAAFLLLYVLMLTARTRLERRRAELEEIYLAVDD